jgi:hypothetical protein
MDSLPSLEVEERGSTILVWAPDWQVGEDLEASLRGVGHAVRRLEEDAQLATGHPRDALLVAQCGPRLEAQRAFLRGPLILVEAGRKPSSALAARAYAIVAQASDAGHAVDRFVEHRHLAQQVAERREPPRRCSRCGRGFDALKARGAGTSRRFVRFGSVALCGACVEALRTLLRQQAQVAVVEADE